MTERTLGLERPAPPYAGPPTSLLSSVGRALGVILSTNRGAVKRLEKIGRKCANRLVRARVEYAIYEVRKVDALAAAALEELGFGDPGAAEGAEALLGGAYVSQFARLEGVLDRLARRITKQSLIDLAREGEKVLRLQAAYLMAFAKVAEDSGKRAAHVLLREGAKDLLSLASKLRLMRRTLKLFPVKGASA